MGQIVVYELNGTPTNPYNGLEDPTSRQDGMKELGKRLATKLTDDRPFKRVISDVIVQLVDFIDPANGGPKYMVRYDMIERGTSILVPRVLQTIEGPSGKKAAGLFELHDPTELNSGADSLRGHLKLNVDRDIKVRDTYEMGITVPRRLKADDTDPTDPLDYVSTILSDLSGIAGPVQKQRYLIARLFFSRCM